MIFTLRKLVETDRTWLASVLGNPKMTRHLPFDPMNIEQSEERLQSYLKLNLAAEPQGAYMIEVDGMAAGYAFF